MKNEAYREYLTGLLNRRGFNAAMASLKSEDLPLTVCLFDLDDLKIVNDTYGHDTGDHIIRTFANLLRRMTREDDIQCRYGGDEFVLIFKRFNDRETVIKKAAEICRTFTDCLSEEQLPTACSVGIVLCGADEKPSEKLIERADKALYRAKRENKGGCCLWEEQKDTVL